MYLSDRLSRSDRTSVIALLTDFGLIDAYVGVMHGVIAIINPKINIIDITHQIPSQNIAAGRYCLMEAYPYFPSGTVYVAVVDPGVGSRRRAIAIELGDRYIICPDNGIVSGVLETDKALKAVELNKRCYWRVEEPSTTFHGRDIFAPVAAYLASGVPLLDLGTEIDPSGLASLPLPPHRVVANRIDGIVQHIDGFGNVITNIPGESLTRPTWHVEIGDREVPCQNSYSSVSVGEVVSLIGSHGWVEIAVNCGNAALELGIDWGDKVGVILEDK